jgi:hypothetical protein
VREHDRGIARGHGFGRGSNCYADHPSTNESEPFYGGNCGFPLTATFTGEVRMTTIEKDDGSVQLIFTPVKPYTITVTNPANGKTLTSLQVASEILQISDSSFVDHRGGITWNFVVPGSAAVLQ